MVAATALLVLGACSSVEPDAVVVDPTPGSSTPGGNGTGGSTPGTSPGGGAADPIGPAEPAEHASLSDWAPCEGGLECATLTVPRDWAEVDGATIDVAVARRSADGERIGSLLLNPGGPGASGVDFVAAFTGGGGLPEGLEDRFDVVGWDPRGTSRSEPIDCTTDEEWLEPDIDPTPEDDADVQAIRDAAEEGLEVCTDTHGDLLGLVGTRATVRDLEALRGALGDEGLTYVGYSYGTTIGLEYLRLYPERVRAMVLDGVSVPGVDPITDTHVQAQGFERTLDAYLAGCASRPTCSLGADPKATLLDLVDRLEDERIEASYSLAVPDSPDREGTLGVGELYIAVASALYTTSDWPTLDRALAEALGSPANGRTLLALRDSYLGRLDDGSWADDADARGAIRCSDQEARVEQPEGDLALADDWAAELPFWGRWFATETPGCWGLDAAVEPLEPLAEGAITEAPPVVVIGTTDDPATPYEQSVDARAIVEGSALVTYVGAEHTAYRSLSACVDDAVTPYLIELTLPADGLRCED